MNKFWKFSRDGSQFLIQNIAYLRQRCSVSRFVCHHIVRYAYLDCSVFYCSKNVLHQRVCCCLVKGISESTFKQDKEHYDFHWKKPPALFFWSVLFSAICNLNFLPKKAFSHTFLVNLSFLSRYFYLFWSLH